MPQSYVEQRTPEYTLRDVAAAVGRLTGATNQEISDVLGIGLSTFYLEFSTQTAKQRIDDLTEKLAPLKVNKREIRAVLKSELNAKLAEHLGVAVNAVEDVLVNADPKTRADNAWKLFDRVDPQAKKLTVDGEVKHLHAHTIQRAIIDEMDADAKLDGPSLHMRAKLLKQGEGVIDVSPT